MRRVVILLVVVGIAYAAVIGLGASRQTSGADGTPQPKIAEAGFVQVLGWLTAPFVPRLEFPSKTVSVPPNMPYHWLIPPSDKAVRVARFTLESGPLAVFKVCPLTSNTPCDSQAACAVPSGVALPAGGTCAASGEPGPSVTISVRKQESGTIWITAPNGLVSLRLD